MWTPHYADAFGVLPWHMQDLLPSEIDAMTTYINQQQQQASGKPTGDVRARKGKSRAVNG